MDNWTLLGSGHAARDDTSVDDGCAVKHVKVSARVALQTAYNTYSGCHQVPCLCLLIRTPSKHRKNLSFQYVS